MISKVINLPKKNPKVKLNAFIFAGLPILLEEEGGALFIFIPKSRGWKYTLKTAENAHWYHQVLKSTLDYT